MESHPVRQAKISRMAEVNADANDLKASSSHSVGAVRRAQRDANRELAEEHDSVEDVEAVELPSERLGEPEEDEGDEEDEPDEEETEEDETEE